MEVEIRGRAIRFADLTAGTFFCALRKERIFGLCIAEGTRAGAILFSTAPPQHQSGVPWVAPGGLPNDDLVAFPTAVMRADPRSVLAVAGPIPFGAIVNSGEKYYMRASNGVGNFVTCDLVSGSLEGIPGATALNLYSRWQVGHVEGDQFEIIFEFSAANE
jgi:hypothetical protein